MSLAKHKMDKLIEAVMEKGYSRHPTDEYDLKFLYGRFMDEVNEIEDEIFRFIMYEGDLLLYRDNQINRDMMTRITNDNIDKIKRELADVSNLIDFLFDKILQLEKIRTIGYG